MKKIMMFLMALGTTVVSYGQFEQGNLLIGGSLGTSFSTHKVKNDVNTTQTRKDVDFSLDPQVGIFIIDNLAIGGALGFSSSSSKYNDGDKYTTTELTVEPMARYYLPQHIFFQGRAIFGTDTEKDKTGNSTTKDHYGVTGFSLGVGYAYFLGENVAIEPLVGYQSKGYKNKDTDIKYVDGGIYIRVGLQVYLRKK